MATFAKSTFSAASYAAFRPVYPPAIYHHVLDYHRGPKKLCLDLGCGTGIVTREMATRFERVIGTDPSAVMIRQAREQSAAEGVDVTFREGRAESSAFLADGTVDCVVAGQAAHWFDYARLWAELERILRPGATVAFWGYKDPAFVDFPHATAVLNRDTYGDHALGPYWDMPGRQYVRELLRVIRPPAPAFGDVRRVEYEPGCEGRRSGEGEVIMEKRLSVGEAKQYLRTYSSFHGWQEAHPDRVARAKGGKGDLLDQMFDEMAETDAALGDESTEVNMEWGSAIVLARKQ